MKLITSNQNPLIKHFTKLRKDRAYRSETCSVFLESQKIILEAQRKHPLKALISKHEDPLDGSSALITNEMAQKISSLKTSDGTFAEIERPENATLEGCQKVLILDQLQDPGNLGALIRSSVAFGFDGLYILEPSVDPYSPKVIRASMGGVLHVPIRIGDANDLKDFLKLNHYQVLVADAQGSPISNNHLQKPVALVLGNEAHGPNPELFSDYTKVAIPIQSMESLNVAIAGSLLMYEMSEVTCP